MFGNYDFFDTYTFTSRYGTVSVKAIDEFDAMHAIAEKTGYSYRYIEANRWLLKHYRE